MPPKEDGAQNIRVRELYEGRPDPSNPTERNLANFWILLRREANLVPIVAK